MPKFWSHITIEIAAANAEVAERIAVGQQQPGYVIRSDAHYLPSVGDIVTVKRPSSGVRDESQLRAGLTYDHTEYQVVKTENFISMGATDIRKIDWVKGKLSGKKIPVWSHQLIPLEGHPMHLLGLMS